MKSFISSMLVGILFVTQTLSLVYAGQPETLPQDMRLVAAEYLDSMGKTLQSVMDTQGIEAAHQEFEKIFMAQMKSALVRAKEEVARMSDTEVNTIVDQLQSTLTTINSEKKAQVLFDISWTNRQKLENILSQSNEIPFNESIRQIQDRAEVVGYEKAFSDLAGLMRSRNIDDGSLLDWNSFFLVSAGLFLVVYVLVPQTETVVICVGLFLIASGVKWAEN